MAERRPDRGQVGAGIAARSALGSGNWMTPAARRSDAPSAAACRSRAAAGSTAQTASSRWRARGGSSR